MVMSSFTLPYIKKNMYSNKPNMSLWFVWFPFLKKNLWLMFP